MVLSNFSAAYVRTGVNVCSDNVWNVWSGGSAIPGAVVGILMGGYVLRQFQLTRRGDICLSLMLYHAFSALGSSHTQGYDELPCKDVTDIWLT